MKNVLGIIGAGTLGQHIAHYAKLSGFFSDIVFFDDRIMRGTVNKYGKVEGEIACAENYIKSGEIQSLLIGIGYKYPELRKKLYEHFCFSINFPNIIHPTCYIDESSALGYGNIMLPGCIVDKDCSLGNNNFLNPGCIIAHDCLLKDHSFFGAGVKVSSSVNIGSCCFFGTGTNTRDNISIGDNIRTGAGALICKSIEIPGTYVGIPARLKE